MGSDKAGLSRNEASQRWSVTKFFPTICLADLRSAPVGVDWIDWADIGSSLLCHGQQRPQKCTCLWKMRCCLITTPLHWMRCVLAVNLQHYWVNHKGLQSKSKVCMLRLLPVLTVLWRPSFGTWSGIQTKSGKILLIHDCFSAGVFNPCMLGCLVISDKQQG